MAKIAESWAAPGRAIAAGDMAVDDAVAQATLQTAVGWLDVLPVQEHVQIGTVPSVALLAAAGVARGR